MSNTLLSVQNVDVVYDTPQGPFLAVDGVSLWVDRAETVGVVGESGCGKTTLARAILGLEPVAGGEITMHGPDGAGKPDPRRMGMVWQDPSASLNPKWTVAKSIREAGAIAKKSIDVFSLLVEVGLDPSLADRYPHELSGGQRQRVAIGRALALRPDLVVCDEPTAALDLSIRAQILNLLKDEQARLGCSFLYISHDLPTVRFLADRILVMYLGTVVENGPADQVFAKPLHPYTALLIDSIPSVDQVGVVPKGGKGEVGAKPTSGCVFAPRCPYAQPICQTAPDPVVPGQHSAACHFAGQWDGPDA